MLLTIWPLITVSKGTLCHVVWIFVYSLAILAINCYFRHFRQLRHFRQNRHFQKCRFAISFEFLFTVWRFWRLIAISAIFAKLATFQRAPLHLIQIFVYNMTILAFNRHFRFFHQIRHFRQRRHFPKGSFAISFEFLFTVWRFWRLIANSAISPNTPFSRKSPLFKGPLCHLIWIFVYSFEIFCD